jgi:hypothetical protein
LNKIKEIHEKSMTKSRTDKGIIMGKAVKTSFLPNFLNKTTSVVFNNVNLPQPHYLISLR